MGHLEIINFPFGTNGNLLFIGVPILKHITVFGVILEINGKVMSYGILFSLQVIIVSLQVSSRSRESVTQAIIVREDSLLEIPQLIPVLWVITALRVVPSP